MKGIKIGTCVLIKKQKQVPVEKGKKMIERHQPERAKIMEPPRQFNKRKKGVNIRGGHIRFSKISKKQKQRSFNGNVNTWVNKVSSRERKRGKREEGIVIPSKQSSRSKERISQQKKKKKKQQITTHQSA